MQARIQVVIVGEDGGQTVREVVTMERTALSPETLGLSLAEGKAILSGVQTVMVEQQVAQAAAEARSCPTCGRVRPSKGRHQLRFRTLFGVVTLTSPRLHQCPCQPHERQTVSPLAAALPGRASPELQYLLTKWAPLASYGVTAKLLADVLPLEAGLHAETVRRHLHRVAERAEHALGDEQACFIEGCPMEWEKLPMPDGPLTVSLDGGFVRARRKQGWFEVIAGRSALAFRRDDPEDLIPPAQCFAFVQSVDQKPKRRLFELLTAQGMQANQQLTFLSDGGETVRAVQEVLHPNAEYVLDWFHVAMRLTVMGQVAKGLPTTAPPIAVDDDDAEGQALVAVVTQAEAVRGLESIKWSLWHGNTLDALEAIDDLAGQTDAAAEADLTAKKLAKALAEFHTYIENNQGAIPNYGERYRNGEAISSATAESTVNQVVSRRMVKKQQMQWTPAGAHLLLQMRTRVLNDDLEALFRTWYPAFRLLADTSDVDVAA
jgi:hypothetical protein